MSLGIDLRVTGHSNQGGRKYMEDYFSVAYQKTGDEKDVGYAYFGIFDGHGGSEAAKFARNHLIREIVKNKLFWSEYDSDVLRAIREGYISTHYAMWREQEKWPKTASGLPSTAGTTASIAFVQKRKIYIGHVGDSGIVLGYQEEGDKGWKARPLTRDHKPECNVEKARIINSGGKVVTKSGVPRVVWNRPRIGHKGPVRRSTPFDEIPFLAVARSLGDLWSYNSALNQFIVSPDPDVRVVKIDPKTFRCLIFGTDGLWNVVSANEAVDLARDSEVINERLEHIGAAKSCEWTNPSKYLVDEALERWSIRKMRADNTSVVTVMLNPTGTPRRDNLKPSYGVKCEVETFHDKHPMGKEISFYCNNRDSFINYDQQQNVIDETSSYHHHYSSICPESNECNVNNFSVMQQYNSNCDSNYSYYENHNTALNMDNSSSNYIFDNTSASYSQNVPSLASTSNFHVHQQQQQQQHPGQISQQHQPDVSYSHSFAESYNSLLISSLESESSSSSSHCSSSSSNSDDSSGDEDMYESHHSYNSLNETGLAGHDHVYHHLPNSNNEQQQRQYQQSCMLDEDGYSLTKLETRVEQRLRNSSNNNLYNRQNERNFQSFQPYNDLDSTNNYNPNPYKSITSSYSLRSNPHFDNNSTNNDNKNLEDIDDNEHNVYTSLDTNEEDIEMRPVNEDNIESDSKNVEYLLDESIQINEISSSNLEASSPIPSPSCSYNTKQPEIIKKPIKSLKTSNQNFHTITRSSKSNKTSFPPDKQNENENSDEKRAIFYEAKRSLRSNNTLSKDIKAKTKCKKQTTNSLNRSIVRNEFLKVANSSSSSTDKIKKLRSRQQQQQQQQQQLNEQTAQIAVWTTRSSRRTISSLAGPNTNALCTNNASNKDLISNNNNNNNLKSINSSVSSSHVQSSTKNNRIQNKTIQSSPATSVSSTTKRSTSSRNSAWCPGKKAVQTRNRVQKR